MHRQALALAVSAAALASPSFAQCDFSDLAPVAPFSSARFGEALDTDGDFAVVGSPNGGLNGEGCVTVYRRVGPAWTTMAEFSGYDSIAGAEFGAAVSVSAKTLSGSVERCRIAVTAPGHDLPGMRQGKAYLFESRSDVNGGAFTLLDEMEDPGSTTTVGGFGAAVALTDDDVFVGSPLDDASGSLSGAVYGYSIDYHTGLVTADEVFTDPTPYGYQSFGSAIDAYGRILVVGAPDDHPFSAGTGTIHGFHEDFDDGWEHEYETGLPPAIGNGFGSSITIAPFEYSMYVFAGAPSLTGDAGEVYLAARHWGYWGAFWDDTLDLIPSPTSAPGDRYGESVHFDGEHLTLSSPGIGKVHQYDVFYTTETRYRLRHELNLTGETISLGAGFVLAGEAGADGSMLGSGTVRAVAIDGELCPEVCDAPRLPIQDAIASAAGTAIATEGDVAMVGAPFEEGSGAVRGFLQDGGCWQYENLPSPATLDEGDLFGASIAALRAEDMFIVGAPGEDQFGVTGPAPGTGAAFIYRRSDDGWVIDASIYGFATPIGSQFGRAVGITEHYNAAINTWEHIAAIGYENYDGSGAVRIWREVVTGGWVEMATISSPNSAPGDGFGSSIYTYGSALYVGAPGEQSVYSFDHTSSGWEVQDSFPAPTPTPGYGGTIARAYGRLLVGAPESETVFSWRTNDSGWNAPTEIQKPAGAVGFGAALTGDYGDRFYIGAPGSNEVYEYFISEYGYATHVDTHRSASGDPTEQYGASLGASPSRFFVGAPGASRAYTYSHSWSAGYSLRGDTHAVSIANAGTQPMALDADTDRAGHLYWMLGSVTGEGPTPWGAEELPLSIDPYFILTLSKPSASPVKPTIGVLDNEGRATATFRLPPGLDAELAGIWLYHAFVAIDPVLVETSFVSESEHLKLVP